MELIPIQLSENNSNPPSNNPHPTNNLHLVPIQNVPDEKDYNDTFGHQLLREAQHTGMGVYTGLAGLANLLGRTGGGVVDALDYGGHALGYATGLSGWKNWKDTPDYNKTNFSIAMRVPDEVDKEIDEYKRPDGTTGKYKDWANRDSFITGLAGLLPAIVPGEAIEGVVTKIGQLLQGGNTVKKYEELNQAVKDIDELSKGVKDNYKAAETGAFNADKATEASKNYINKNVEASDLHTQAQHASAARSPTLSFIGNSLTGQKGLGIGRMAAIGGVQGAAASSTENPDDIWKNALIGAGLGEVTHVVSHGIRGGYHLVKAFLPGNETYSSPMTYEEFQKLQQIEKQHDKAESAAQIDNSLKSNSLAPRLTSEDNLMVGDNPTHLTESILNATPKKIDPIDDVDYLNHSQAWSYLDPSDPSSTSGAMRGLLQHIENHTQASNLENIQHILNHFQKNIVNPALIEKRYEEQPTTQNVFNNAFNVIRNKSESGTNPYMEGYLTNLISHSKAYKTLQHTRDLLSGYTNGESGIENELAKADPIVRKRAEQLLKVNDNNPEAAYTNAYKLIDQLEKPSQQYIKKAWELGEKDGQAVLPDAKDRLQAFEREAFLQNQLEPNHNPYSLTNGGIKSLSDAQNELGEDIRKNGNDQNKGDAYNAMKDINDDFRDIKNKVLNEHYGTDNLPYMEALHHLHMQEKAAEVGREVTNKITGGINPVDQEVPVSTLATSAHKATAYVDQLNKLVDQNKNNKYLQGLLDEKDNLQRYAQNLQQAATASSKSDQNNVRKAQPLENLFYALNMPKILKRNNQLKQFEKDINARGSTISQYYTHLISNSKDNNPLTNGHLPLSEHLSSHFSPFGVSLWLNRLLGEGHQNDMLAQAKNYLADTLQKKYANFPSGEYKLTLDKDALKQLRDSSTPENDPLKKYTENDIENAKRLHWENIRAENHLKTSMNKMIQDHQKMINDLSRLKAWHPMNTLFDTTATGAGVNWFNKHQGN